MKVLISVNAAWNIWNFRRALVEALLDDGHEVIVLAPKDDTAPRLEALGCTVRHLEMNVKGINPVQDFKLLTRLRRHFRDLQPDAILSFTIKNNIFGALAAKWAGVLFVPNVTGLGTAFLSGGMMERMAMTLYRAAFRNLPVIFFQNEDDRNLFLERRLVTEDQARCLPGSGIDLDRFAATDYPAEDAPTVFLMIARLLLDKGVLEYVDAARRLKDRHVRCRFQLLGATDALNRTAISRETVQVWEDDGLVEYLGVVDDVRPSIQAAHCVVLPSYREGAPRTLIEAAALARPVIATDVPGCRAVVEHEKTGLLCEVRSGESLAAACERFVELLPKERAAMGLAGRAKMEREYSHGIVIDAYRSVLRTFAPKISRPKSLRTIF